MTKKIINPFNDESESLQIGGLTIENRVDRISIYGSIDLTLDKVGLVNARQLKEVLDLTLAELEKAELPDKISLAPADTVDNPFA
jgi:hypothetical protein